MRQQKRFLLGERTKGGEREVLPFIAMMSSSRRSRYSSRSPSPYRRRYASSSLSRLRSRSMSRSRSRSRDSSDVGNLGNNLYVTGLSPRVTKRELEKHFSSKGGMVIDIHLVIDPWTRESRGFGFVTMASVEEADRCIKYMNRSVLEGRVITVEKARRRRGRTPTPGRYLGAKSTHVRRRSPSYSPYRRGRYSSPCYSSERDWDWDRSYSPYYSRHRSPYPSERDRSYSPYYRWRRSHSRYSRSPISRRDRSYSPYYSRHVPRTRYSQSPIGKWDRSYYLYYSRHRSRSRSYSHDRAVSPYYRRRYRSISRSPSPMVRRSSRRSSSRSTTPRPRSFSQSVSPKPRKSHARSPSRSLSRRHWSHRSYRGISGMSSLSRSPSRSPSPSK